MVINVLFLNHNHVASGQSYAATNKLSFDEAGTSSFSRPQSEVIIFDD